VPRVEVQAADRAVAARLSIPEGTQAVRRIQERYIDRMPWSWQDTVYPAAV
jgi:DNA-binding GntR family transcriptional regulator